MFFQFRKLKNKKGLSLIVTTLLIILLVLVAIGIIWFVVKNFLSEGAEGISFGRFSLDLEIKAAFIDAENITINIKRNPGAGDFAGIKFIYYTETDSENIDTNITLEELGEKSFSFELTQLDVSDIEKVSIALIYESDSGKTSIGRVLDTFDIYSAEGEEPDPETCEPIVNPCGDWVCGDAQNGTCADVICGECGGTDTCTNGVCVPDDCVSQTEEETCDGWECGDKTNNCGTIVNCGPCDGTCTNGICVPDDCVPDENPCGSWVCGDILNGTCGEISCGECGGTDICINGACIIEASVNSGVVGSVWPAGATMYFDSEDLPTDVDYSYYYVRFPGSAETGCLLIADYITPILPEVYDKTHIQFNFPSNVQSDDNYEIWQTQTGCLGA